MTLHPIVDGGTTERIVTREAEARADLIGVLIRPLLGDDEADPDVVVNVVRQFVADTYEVAYGRGYDDGCYPPVSVMGTQPEPPPSPPLPPGGILPCSTEARIAEVAESLGLRCDRCRKPAIFIPSPAVHFPGTERPMRWMHFDWDIAIYDHDVERLTVAQP